MTETSRISSKRKGLACSKGGGDSGTFLSDRRVSNGNTITTHDCLFPCELTTELTSSLSPTWYDRLPGFLRATSNGQAACMIIEDYTPTPPTTAKKPRQQPRHQDTTQRFLNFHLVLPKNRTSKFSRFVFTSLETISIDLVKIFILRKMRENIEVENNAVSNYTSSILFLRTIKRKNSSVILYRLFDAKDELVFFLSGSNRHRKLQPFRET